jgi:hypothetical protein
MSKLIIIVLFLSITCQCTNDRNKISFNVPIVAMEDSIKVMNSILSSYSEFNYYLDDANVLYLGTNKVAKIDSNFLGQANSLHSKYTGNDKRFFSIILFLKANSINSCYRDKQLGVIVYDFKPTKDDRFEDIRLVIINDNQIDTKSMWFKKLYNILDDKEDLLLISPIDYRK